MVKFPINNNRNERVDCWISCKIWPNGECQWQPEKSVVWIATGGTSHDTETPFLMAALVRGLMKNLIDYCIYMNMCIHKLMDHIVINN